VVVVNQTLARGIWPNADPLGQRVRLGGGPDAPVRTVVGVVGDTLHHGFEGEPTMQIYLPHAQHATSFMQLVVRADREPQALLNTIRREVWAINSAVPVQDPSIMTELLASSVGARKFSMLLVGLFAAVAVLLAGLGLYAVIAFGVTQRAREIGIRIALGAARRDIIRLVMWEGLALAGAGVVVGLLGAWVLARGVSGLLYDITPGDPVTYALSGVVVLVVACAASFLPALRAGSFDPSVTLRNE
jgi:putative ABC transport system permease protein